MGDSEAAAEKVVFKKPARKAFRKRERDGGEASAAGDDDSATSASLEAMRELQRQRQRSKGVTLEAKGLEDEAEIEAEAVSEDKAGDHSLDSTFTSQAEAGEVDANMLKYIEEQMQKGEGGSSDAPAPRASVLDPEEAELYTTPAHLTGVVPGGSVFAEEESANRWLAGIMEVPLGAEDKMAAIERTEEAKRQLMVAKLEREKAKASGVAAVIPTNFNSNFHQHRREFAQARGRGGSGGGGGGRGSDASDGSAYGKFKSNERRKN